MSSAVGSASMTRLHDRSIRASDAAIWLSARNVSPRRASTSARVGFTGGRSRQGMRWPLLDTGVHGSMVSLGRAGRRRGLRGSRKRDAIQQLLLAPHAGAPEDTLQVVAHRLLADAEPAGNRGHAKVLQQQAHHLLL